MNATLRRWDGEAKRPTAPSHRMKVDCGYENTIFLKDAAGFIGSNLVDRLLE